MFRLHHKLFFLCVLLFPELSQGKIIKDCVLIEHAKKLGAIDPHLVLAVVKVESSNNSKAKCLDQYGLMQIKLGTARMLGFKGKPKQLLDWKKNLKLGIKYLNQKIKKHTTLQAAAAAYNAGKPFICRKGKKCIKGEFVNQSYVNKVMSKYKKHKKLICSASKAKVRS